MPTVSRRNFLRTTALAGGGLVLWFTQPASRPMLALAQSAPARGGGFGGAIPKDVDSWLKVGTDGTVSLFSGKVEFGQGIQTAFAQLVADELDVPLSAVQVVMGSTDQVPYDNPTVGSQSMRATGPLVRQAAAEMRQWLLDLGAQQLGAARDTLSTSNGTVLVTAQPDQSVTYAQLAAGQQSGRQMSGQAPLKTPDQFVNIGQEVPRVDVPFKVNGSMKFGYDTTVPGMLHGKILRPPSLGATLQSVDYSQAQGMPGVSVFRDGDFVGVAADRLDHAQSALATINATWNELDSPTTDATIFDLLKSTPDQGQPTGDGDPGSALAQSAQRVSVTVRAPYVAHMSIEPESALAQPNGDALEVWASTQAPFALQRAIASALQRPADSVIVHAVMSGGAFGRKALTDAGIEAARLAVGLGQPVRVNWTREEEFLFDQFRPAMLIELETGLDGNGNLVGWKYDLYAAAYYKPFGDGPMFASANAGANATVIYAIPSALTTFYQSQTPLPVHNWRANGAPVNALARETALDELAEKASTDPVTFRSRLLANNPRMLAVLQAAVQQAGWTPGVGSTGQGVGVALDFADGTYVAEVAKVAVEKASGTIRAQHIDVAVDCGLVVNPAGARAQIEGGVIGQGVSSTLKEAIQFANGRITNNTVARYQPLRMTEAPSVNVVFVEDKNQPMQGLGEPAVGPVSAAISNAVYDAIGARLRDLPFTPDRLKAATRS
jgi:isoquinoline 1-oxidoreductase